MAVCDDRQLTEAQRVAGYQNQRTGVQQAVRPFSGRPTIENLIDYINRELQPAVKRTRDKVNDVYLQVADNAPSGNPLGFYFSTDTTNGDPTTGRIRLNQATQDTATIIRVSESNGRLADVAPWLDVMAGGATTPLGVVTLTDAINPTRFIRFDLNTMLDQGAYWDLGVTPIESSHDNPFVDGGAVVIAFIPGVGGATPATVPGTSISGADGPRQFLATSTSTTVDFRSLSAIFPGAPIYDVMAYPFNALGNGTGDDLAAINAAIAAANATGGVVYLGVSHRISAGLDALTGSCVMLIGRGEDSGGTSLLCTTAPAAIVTVRGRYCGVAGMRVGCLTASASGHAIVLTEAFRPTVRNVRTLAVGNGVEIDRCNTAKILDVEVTQVLGSYGFYVHGVDPDFNHNTRYERCKVATAFPLDEEEMRGDWAPSTAYTLGQFVRANGGIWQVSTAGTSSGAGSGPSGLPSTNTTLVYTTPVTDGTVQWLYVSGAYTGFAHGSFAHTVAYEYCGVQHGYYGMHVFDDQGDAPALVNAWRFSCDKPHHRGIFLAAGDNLEFDQTFITSAMQAAVEIGTNAHSWQFLGGQLYAQAREGVIIGGSGGKLVGVEVAGSSTEPPNTYDGVSITSGVTDIVITGCTIGNIPGRNSGARYCISIGAACNRYAITDNILIGGDTGAILDGTAGRSDTRVIFNNLPDTRIAQGSVWGLTINHGASDVPREVTKFGLGEQIRYATSVADATSTGTIQTYTVAETTTQVHLQLAGAVVVRGLTIITGKRIVFHFDSGFAGSFTFNHEDGAAAATGNRVRCPGGVALTMVANDTVVLERFENRWRVCSVSKASTALTDGDKGDITVTASGATWTVDTNIAKTWTGVHSHTGASHTINVTGAVAIDADAASHFTTSVGNLTLSTTAAGSRVIVSGADDVLIEAVADDVFINSGGLTQVASTAEFRVSTNGTERLEIEPDGAWQLAGDQGSLGSPMLSQGASSPPIWGDRSDVTDATIIAGGSSAASTIVTLTIPANTLVVGSTYELYAHCRYVRNGSPATSHDVTMNAEANGSSMGLTLLVSSGTQNSNTSHVIYAGTFTCLTAGGSGTAIATLTVDQNIALATNPLTMNAGSGGAGTINTTASNTIRLRVAFSAGVTGASFDCRRAWIKRTV